MRPLVVVDDARVVLNTHQFGRPTDLHKIPDLIDFVITRNRSHSMLRAFSNCIKQKKLSPRLVNKLPNWCFFKLQFKENIKLSIPLISGQQLRNETEFFVKEIEQGAYQYYKNQRQ